MAQVHNELRRGPLGSALKNALGDTRSESMLERWGETMQPVLDLWAMPEWAYLRRDYLWSIRRVQGAIAAEFGGVAIVNPVGSKALLVLEGAQITAAGAAGKFFLTHILAADVATYTKVGPLWTRDQRVGQLTATTGLVNAELYAGTDPVGFAANAVEVIWCPTAGTSPFLTPPYIIRPGGGIAFECGTVNVAFDSAFWGRWRQAPPTEFGSP